MPPSAAPNRHGRFLLARDTHAHTPTPTSIIFFMSAIDFAHEIVDAVDNGICPDDDYRDPEELGPQDTAVEKPFVLLTPEDLRRDAARPSPAVRLPEVESSMDELSRILGQVTQSSTSTSSGSELLWHMLCPTCSGRPRSFQVDLRWSSIWRGPGI